MPQFLRENALFKTEGHWSIGGYLRFKDEGPVSPGSKTRKYAVHSTHNGALLGYVKWYVHWRQYVFAPLNSIFDKKCLRELAEFCEQATNAQREKRKK